MHVIYQRLQTAPQQLRQMVATLEGSLLRYRPGDKWSIAEHCGHLFILEPLWRGRIIDIIEGKPVLTSADLENKATFDAGFNEMDIEQVLADFERERKLTLQQLDLLTEEDLVKQSFHPRIKQPMRIRDHAYFVAEHDAHHLERIRWIIDSNRAV